jgi:hypothetical protein
LGTVSVTTLFDRSRNVLARNRNDISRN